VHELGADFQPLKPHPRATERIKLLREAWEEGVKLPPIDLYKLGFGYYVLDGHRRVAVARMLGDDVEIDANVTEFVPSGNLLAQRGFTARRAFEQATGLTRVGATQPESYPRLQALIEDYAQHIGQEDLEEAASYWYREEFLPLRRRIREHDLTRHFPSERPADLIARVGEWRAAEAKRTGSLLSWEDALKHFAAQPQSNGDRS
jgi:hypothetical protein